MDNKTFCEAYQHNSRTKEHLINLLKARVDKNPNYSLFLGAGASTSSGIKTTKKMIEQWRKTRYATYKGSDNFQNWLEKQEWHTTEDEYSRLFELVYDQPTQRRIYIEKCVKDAKPHWGYAYLTGLIKEGVFNVVFTTNFDDLVNDACYAFTNNLRPMVCAHDSAVSSVRLVSERPKVVKLHGDFLYDSIKNTSSELQSLENNMREKFAEFAKQYGLVVIGYGGNDQSVMDLLDVLVRSNNYFRNGIYWCLRKGANPGKRLRQLLRNDRVFWVEIDGFDEIMAELAEATGVSLPDGVLAPHTTALKRVEHLVESTDLSSNRFLKKALGDLGELNNRIKKALDDVGLGESQNSNSKYSTLERISTTIVPFMKARDLLRAGKVPEACILARQVLEGDSSELQEVAWYLLIEALLRDAKTHAEAVSMLAAAPKSNWVDAAHFTRMSYFNLHLCNSEAALTFAKRALELNRELVPAKINKALALHFKQSPDLNSVLTELKASNMEEQHQAAVYAIEGNLFETMHYLQRAFVLGRYSLESLCEDVAFRVFWGLPDFESQLRTVLGDVKFDYPLKNACPMSDAEKAVRVKLQGVS